MAVNKIIPTTKIGVYTIYGDIRKIGYLFSNKIRTELYYNRTENKFFWVKWFVSGKCHIDFFDTTGNAFDRLLGTGEVVVGICNAKNSIRELYYSHDLDRYIVYSYDGETMFKAVMQPV